MGKAEEAAASKRFVRKNPPCLNCTADGYTPNAITSSLILCPGNMDYLLADMITPFLYAMGVNTPNKVTMLNFCVVRIASIYLLLFGGVAGMWLQFVLMPLTQVLDAADGQMARRYGLGSAFGAWLDHTTDNLFGMLLCASMLYRFYIADGSTPFVITVVTFMLMALFGNTVMDAMDAGIHYSKMTTLQKIGMHQILYMTYFYIAIPPFLLYHLQ